MIGNNPAMKETFQHWFLVRKTVITTRGLIVEFSPPASAALLNKQNSKRKRKVRAYK